MWLSCEQSKICINLNWVETYSFNLNNGTGVINFSWGNDPLHIQGEIATKIKGYLSLLPATKNKIRLFHAFRYKESQILIDLSEIKVIVNIKDELIFYRRYFNGNNWIEAEEHGEIARTDNAEWESLLSEINSQMHFWSNRS